MGGVTGKRVSNAWVTYPREGDNPPKGGLIPHNEHLHQGGAPKARLWLVPSGRPGMGPRPIR